MLFFNVYSLRASPGHRLGSEDLFREHKKVIKLIKNVLLHLLLWIHNVSLLLVANRVSCLLFGGFLGFKLTAEFE